MSKFLSLVTAMLFSVVTFSQAQWCGTTEADQIKRNNSTPEQLLQRKLVEEEIN